MSHQSPSTITVFVDPLEKTSVPRPFGLHPVLAAALTYIAALLTAVVVAALKIDPWIVACFNMMALLVPAALILYCYSKPVNILRANRKWLEKFHAGLRLETGEHSYMTNSTEFMIALRSGEPAYADLSIRGVRKTYDVAVSGDEVVLFSVSDIDREWAMLNADMGH